jgi:hypothetical protein
VMLIGRMSRVADERWWIAECETIQGIAQGACRDDGRAMLADLVRAMVGRDDFEARVDELDEHHRCASWPISQRRNSERVCRLRAGRAEPSLSKFIEVLAAVAPEAAMTIDMRGSRDGTIRASSVTIIDVGPALRDRDELAPPPIRPSCREVELLLLARVDLGEAVRCRCAPGASSCREHAHVTTERSVQRWIAATVDVLGVARSARPSTAVVGGVAGAITQESRAWLESDWRCNARVSFRGELVAKLDAGERASCRHASLRSDEDLCSRPSSAQPASALRPAHGGMLAVIVRAHPAAATDDEAENQRRHDIRLELARGTRIAIPASAAAAKAMTPAPMTPQRTRRSWLPSRQYRPQPVTRSSRSRPPPSRRVRWPSRSDTSCSRGPMPDHRLPLQRTSHDSARRQRTAGSRPEVSTPQCDGYVGASSSRGLSLDHLGALAEQVAPLGLGTLQFCDTPAPKWCARQSEISAHE